VILLTRYAAILWFGLMAGFFFAYSLSVPDGLLAVSPAVAMEAMQAINANIRTAIFAVVFFGSAVVAFLLALTALMRRTSGSWPALCAALIYLGGAFAVTVFGNIPLNEALANANPAGADVGVVVADYFRDWTQLNHVRTVSSTAALVLAAIALRRA